MALKTGVETELEPKTGAATGVCVMETRDVLIRSMGLGSGPIWSFFRWSASAILNVDPSPIFLFIYLFIFFFMSEHNLWQNADAHVTLLWQICR